MEPISTVAGIATGKMLFEKLIQELCQKTGQKIRQWNTSKQIGVLYQKINLFRKVKTIWQVDKVVDLTDFYCDSHVVIADKRKKISQLADFSSKENILIQGIAGQGKSIFLRYLCISELSRGQYIPLFIELRKISQKDSLKDRIYAAFEGLGLKIDNHLFDAFANSGKLLLLLDAFDEIPDDLKTRTITEMEDTVASRPNLKVIVTSRPSQSIQMSNHFMVVKLDNLQGDEYAQVVSKLASGQVEANNIINHIKTKARHIKELLCTPLMVTLLVLSYKSCRQLPTKLSDFYDSLFQMLLQRHDGTKPGFVRQRSCKLDDKECRQAFETLCIFAKKENKQSFSEEVIYNLSKEALGSCDFHENSSKYINDIVNITCLLIRDGEEYRFIHKTVQEYYTASYIQKKPESWGKDFYKKALVNEIEAKKRNMDWGQELEFLSEIDSYRYNKYFLLPAILRILDLNETDLLLPSHQIAFPSYKKFFSSIFIVSEGKSNYYYTVQAGLPDFITARIISNIVRKWYILFKEYSKKNIDNLPTVKQKDFGKLVPFRVREDSVVIKFESLIESGEFPAVINEINKECEGLFDKAKSIQKSMAADESPSFLDGLL